MLKNKVALITGSSRGIGKEVARLFLEDNAKVVICGSRIENATKTMNEFIDLGYSLDNILAIGIDMTDTDSIKNAVEKTIKEFGKIDILVNNAGITSNVSLLDSSDEDFYKMYDINVFGVVKLTREVVKYMKDYGGSIINTSSIVSLYGGNNQSAYASSKYAINGLTKSWARELGKYKIRVNAVAPGVVNTDMMNQSVNEEMKNKLIKMTPLNKILEPKDLSGTYLYLASDSSKYVTGNIITVDGGIVL